MSGVYKIVSVLCLKTNYRKPLSTNREKFSVIFVKKKLSFQNLYIEPEMHYVAVLHDIILAFDVDFAGVAAGGF